MSHEAFLAEIIANPDDDTPRLIYADWLEDQGDHRAEFIRIQCEHASLPLNDPRGDALLERENQLLNLYGREWSKQIQKYSQFVVFNRGFVETVTMRLSDAVDRLGRILKLTPLRGVHLIQISKGRMSDLAQSELLTHLRKFDFSGSVLNFQVIHEFAASPYLMNIEALDFSKAVLSRQSAILALGHSPTLTSLKQLNLSMSNLRDPELRVLSTQPAFQKLEKLDLSEIQATDAGWVALFDKSYLQSVKWLNLCRNQLSSNVINAVINWSANSHIETLVVNSEYLSSEDLDRLETSLKDKLVVLV